MGVHKHCGSLVVSVWAGGASAPLKPTPTGSEAQKGSEQILPNLASSTEAPAAPFFRCE